MSVVTTVVVMHAEDFGYHEGALKRYIEAFPGNSQGRCEIKELDSCDDVGGYKCAEIDILVGAYNHMDVDGFFRYLAEYPWESPEEAVVVVNTSSPTDVTVTWRPN